MNGCWIYARVIDDDLLRRPSFTSSRVFDVLASVPHSVSALSATQGMDRPTVSVLAGRHMLVHGFEPRVLDAYSI